MPDYSDIISLSRPVSSHPPMAREHRAKQFAPFAALKGHGQMIRDSEFVPDAYCELTDERKEEICRVLEMIEQAGIGKARATYYVPVFFPSSSASARIISSSPNGKYVEIQGEAWINRMEGALYISGERIRFEDLYEVEIF